jgi:hypothetical protein
MKGRTFNIRTWVNYIKQYGVAAPSEIEQHADEITRWQAKSRYSLDFYASKD